MIREFMDLFSGRRVLPKADLVWLAVIRTALGFYGAAEIVNCTRHYTWPVKVILWPMLIALVFLGCVGVWYEVRR